MFLLLSLCVGAVFGQTDFGQTDGKSEFLFTRDGKTSFQVRKNSKLATLSFLPTDYTIGFDITPNGKRIDALTSVIQFTSARVARGQNPRYWGPEAQIPAVYFIKNSRRMQIVSEPKHDQVVCETPELALNVKNRVRLVQRESQFEVYLNMHLMCKKNHQVRPIFKDVEVWVGYPGLSVANAKIENFMYIPRAVPIFEQAVSSIDKRVGCPAPLAPERGFLFTTVSLSYPDSIVSVVARVPRDAIGRTDLYLVKLGVDRMAHTLAYTSVKKKTDMMIMWSEPVPEAGLHTFYLTGSAENAFGCYDRERIDVWGSMEIVVQPYGTVLHQAVDKRPGCGENSTPANTDLISKVIEIYWDDTPVEIYGHMVRRMAGESKLHLMVGDGDEPVDVGLAWTDEGDGPQFQSALVHWVGYLSKGKHKVALRGTTANVWGCGPELGTLDVLTFEKDLVIVKRQGDTRPGCPAEGPKSGLILGVDINVGNNEGIFAKATGQMMSKFTGDTTKAKLRMGFNGYDVRATRKSMPRNSDQMLDNVFHWQGDMKPGKNDLDLVTDDKDIWGCGVAWGALDLVVYLPYSVTGPFDKLGRRVQGVEPTLSPTQTPTLSPTFEPTEPTQTPTRPPTYSPTFDPLLTFLTTRCAPIRKVEAGPACNTLKGDVCRKAKYCRWQVIKDFMGNPARCLPKPCGKFDSRVKWKHCAQAPHCELQIRKERNFDGIMDLCDRNVCVFKQ